MKLKLIAVPCFLLYSFNSMSQTNTNMDRTRQDYSTEIIRYAINDNAKDGFIKAYTDASRFLKDSMYCLGYELIQGEEEPHNFIVIIHWTSKEDHIDGFRKSEEFKRFFELVRPFYNNIQEMKHYTSRNGFKK